MRSETKIFNLDSDEFGSNPPLKNVPPFPFRSPKTMGTEVKKKAGNVSYFLVGLELLFRIRKPGTFKKF